MSKSICFISGGLSGGGQERALTYLANEFASRGIHISIICLFKTELFFELHPNIKVVWPLVNRITTNKFVYALKLVPYIRRNVKQINPDTIVSFGDWFNSYSLIATRFLDKPVYITNRMGPNLYLGRFLEFFNKRTYKKATAMIVQTARAKEIMQSKYKVQNISVIPEKSIITVGRLTKAKGHQILIEAFSHVSDKSWRLDIVGDGPEMESLKRLVQQLELQSNVHFHGHKKEFNYLLAKASIFVLPSYYEGFPNALLEAMSVPLACVSSNCIAGPSDIITNGEDGFLFQTGNTVELTAILNELISNPLKIEYLEKNAYKVRERFDFQSIANDFLEIISN
jgi:glycosyltransferase involved in cell wall biosynthesis